MYAVAVSRDRDVLIPAIGGLCTIAVNEIEGFVSENMTEIDIENKLKNGLCKTLGGAYVFICDEVAQYLPKIVCI